MRDKVIWTEPFLVFANVYSWEQNKGSLFTAVGFMNIIWFVSANNCEKRCYCGMTI